MFTHTQGIYPWLSLVIIHEVGTYPGKIRQDKTMGTYNPVDIYNVHVWLTDT